MSDDEFVQSGLIAAIKTASNLEKRIAELEAENAALREQLQWTTRRIEILSTTFYGIEDLFKNALTEMFEDSLQVKEKEPQP